MSSSQRIYKALQLKEFTIDGIVFPKSNLVKIILDKKSSKPKKLHCIVYQQGSQYGRVGDYCTYINHAQLLELHINGQIKLI